MSNTMMRTFCIIGLIASSSAAPAFVFHSSIKDQSYKSYDLDALSLLESIPFSQEGKKNVIFVLERADDGAESLSMLASEKKLEKIESRPYEAHSHVSQIDSVTNIIRHVDTLAGRKGSCVSSSLSDINKTLDAKVDSTKLKRSTYVVKVSPKFVNDVDTVVDTVLSRSDVSSVLLTAIRSFSEVKAARLENKLKSNGRRRLEENGANADDSYGDYDPSRYYVSLTPNIMAGLLFFFFFAMSAIVGIGCMGRIAGQEVFTDKSPPVGREA